MYNKNILTTIAFFSIISILYSCSESSGSASASTQTSTAVSDNEIHFTVNDKPVATSGWNISRFDMGQGVGLNITTNMHEDKRTVAFNLSGYQPGIYQISDKRSANSAYGDYKPDYTDLLNSYQFTEGSVNIISIDTVKGLLNASFSGTAIKGSEKIKITDGKIVNGKLRTGITKY